jgi:hypothetical protein
MYTAGGLQVTYDSYFSSSVFVNGNLTVFGTQSVVHVSSSQFNIGTNIITVNTSTPSIRYGGLSVYDSGSTGLSGSIFWDSEANHWIYANASGSGGGDTYTGGMFISGPRNTRGLGCEQGTTSCMLLVGQGGDHLTSSLVYHDSTKTCFYGTSLFVNSCGNVGIGTNSPFGKFNVVAGNGISFVVQDSGLTDTIELTNYSTVCGIRNIVLIGSTLSFTTAVAGAGSGTEKMRITSCGNVGIGTCAPTARLQVIAPESTSGLDSFGVIGQNSLKSVQLGATSSYAWIQSHGSVPLRINELGNNVLIAVGGSNVGIGSSTPGGILQVSSENSGNTQVLLVRNYATSATGTFTGCYTAEVRATSNGNVRHGMLIHSAENDSTRRVLDITSLAGNIMTFSSMGATTWGNSTYMISGTTGFRFNSSDDAFNNFVALNNGNATLRGTLTQNASDERLKNNIQTIPNAISKITQLKGVTFEWNKEMYETSRTTDIGIIAQDVKQVLPDAVALAPFDTNFDDNTSKSGENYLTVYYEKLIPLLIEGMKEQQCTINILKTCIGIA